MTQTQTPKSFEASLEELDALVQQIREGELPLNQLSDAVKRARVLLESCQHLLTATEEELNALLLKDELQ